MAAAKRQNTPRPPAALNELTSPDTPSSTVADAPLDWRQSRAAPLLVLVAIGAAIALVYGPGIRAEFVHDDGASITNNHSIVRLWPPIGSPGPLNPVKDLPTSGRPLVNLTLAINYHFGRYNPVGYHLFNYVVHALNATLLWAFVRRVLRLDYFQGAFARQAGWLAFAIALVWALHPLQTQSVEYVTQRTELLLALCYLSTMYASLRYLTTAEAVSRQGWLVVATLSCLAGMACKEVMATAPLMVALLDRTFVAGSWRRVVGKSWPLYAALASCWLLLLALNIGGPRSASAGFQDELPAHVWWLTQCKVLAIYLKLVFWPAPLLMHYELPRLETLGAAWPWVLPVAAAIVGTLVLLYRYRATGFLGAWFFLILAPTLIVPVVTEVAAERRLYLPLASIVTFVILGACRLIESIARRGAAEPQAVSQSGRTTAIVVSASLGIAAICGVASARRVIVYLDNVALWQSVLDVQPENVVAQASIAEALDQRGRREEAMEHMQQALSIAPDSYITQHQMGTMLLVRGRIAEAIPHFERVVQLKPKSASALNNLAFALNAAGQTPQAMQLYDEALKLEPNYVEAHTNLATALANQGKLDEALAHYALAVRMQPDLAGAHKSIGIILINTGRLPDAIEHLETAARLEPDIDTYARLAIAYANSQRVDKALASIDQALELARATGQSELIETLQALRANLQTLQPKLQ
jgi:tetratricopeptide (TPR) repeat protein